MWNSADEYCERMAKKEERIKQLCEKYKQSDNEEIKELIEYLEDIKFKYEKCDERKSEYFDKLNKTEWKLRNYKIYVKKLENDLKIKYRLYENIKINFEVLRKKYEITED